MDLLTPRLIACLETVRIRFNSFRGSMMWQGGGVVLVPVLTHDSCDLRWCLQQFHDCSVVALLLPRQNCGLHLFGRCSVCCDGKTI